MNKASKSIVNEHVSYMLSKVISDNQDRNRVMDGIMEEIYNDIEETSDYASTQSLCLDDIDIALSRVLVKKLVGE